MARLYLTNLDLNKNQLLNGVIQVLASAPGSPSQGQVYYDSTLAAFGVYTGSAWRYLGTLDQISVAGADVDLNSHKIINVTDPTAAQHAATKNYVDLAIQGIKWKADVRVATTTNGTLATAFANGQTVDGVTIATGDRILLKNQTSVGENGIYTVNASGAPTRASDADTGAELVQAAVFVKAGTTNADTGWVATADTITLGTTDPGFVQFTGAAQIVAGGGLTKTGNTLDVGAGTGITVNADDVAVNTSVVNRKFSASIGDGAATSFNVNPALGTTDLIVQLHRNSDGVQVEADVTVVSATQVTVGGFPTAPTSNQYRVTVTG